MRIWTNDGGFKPGDYVVEDMGKSLRCGSPRLFRVDEVLRDGWDEEYEATLLGHCEVVEMGEVDAAT